MFSLSLENALHNNFEEHILSCLCYVMLIVGDTNVNIYEQEVGFSLFLRIHIKAELSVGGIECFYLSRLSTLPSPHLLKFVA